MHHASFCLNVRPITVARAIYGAARAAGREELAFLHFNAGCGACTQALTGTGRAIDTFTMAALTVWNGRSLSGFCQKECKASLASTLHPLCLKEARSRTLSEHRPKQIAHISNTFLFVGTVLARDAGLVWLPTFVMATIMRTAGWKNGLAGTLKEYQPCTTDNWTLKRKQKQQKKQEPICAFSSQ